MIEQAGFKVAYAGGGSQNALMGRPDGGSTMTEILAHVGELTAAVKIPVVLDVETGFGSGSPLDLMRTIRECERVGVSAVHCEDHVTAVKTGGLKGPVLIPREEMLKKIEAALEARQDDDFVFIARTDARKRYGLEEALERGKAYAKAGADMIVVSALETVDELKRAVDYVGAPLVMFNGAVRPGALGNKLTSLNARELQDIGVKLVTFGNGVIRAVAKAVDELLEEIKRAGTDNGYVDRMISKERLYEIVGTPARDELRKRYLNHKDYV